MRSESESALVPIQRTDISAPLYKEERKALPPYTKKNGQLCPLYKEERTVLPPRQRQLWSEEQLWDSKAEDLLQTTECISIIKLEV